MPPPLLPLRNPPPLCLSSLTLAFPPLRKPRRHGVIRCFCNAAPPKEGSFRKQGLWSKNLVASVLERRLGSSYDPSDLLRQVRTSPFPFPLPLSSSYSRFSVRPTLSPSSSLPLPFQLERPSHICKATSAFMLLSRPLPSFFTGAIPADWSPEPWQHLLRQQCSPVPVCKLLPPAGAVQAGPGLDDHRT